MSYNPHEIEAKWQKYWEDHGTYTFDPQKQKDVFYNLVMFPYPSGDRLHLGHWYSYAPPDSFGRFKRMRGYHVFQPIGYDSFGLPAENHAIKTGTPPRVSTQKNIAVMTRQLKAIGPMYDWSYTLRTSEPEYYKWTQWIFSELFKAGLAYQKESPANWCNSCMTTLANEQVIGGQCERCQTNIQHKMLKQWFLKISKYAEELLDFSDLDWPTKTKTMQTNWIGRSEGFEFSMLVQGSDDLALKFFTTRIDTIFGVTYCVLSPEHPDLAKIVDPKHKLGVDAYLDATARKTDIERSNTKTEKTGIFTGAYCYHPFNNEKIPIWVADYVLMNYGTGAIMAVPAHDERDFAFAKKYQLPIQQVIVTPDQDRYASTHEETAYTGDGIMINSEDFSEIHNLDAKKRIAQALTSAGKGKQVVMYRLKDWCISRQRYWGAPIPIIHCVDCGPVLEENLPLELPQDIEFRPTGESPLKDLDSFVNTTCPKCHKAAKRETDTMDTFVDSSWYFLRYPMKHDPDKAFDQQTLQKFLPVDMYVGGAEHAIMHLLYARFITKALADLKYLNFREPFQRLFHQGCITKDGAKMSKSRGNVVAPDAVVEKYGSDVLRLYIMFIGPYDEGADWNDTGIGGLQRFLRKIHQFTTQQKFTSKTPLPTLQKLHQTIKKVTQDIEKLHFNTAISALMEALNTIHKQGISLADFKTYLLLLSPLAPHLAEECLSFIGSTISAVDQPWPNYDNQYLTSDKTNIVIQINGKLRGHIEIATGTPPAEIIKQAKTIPTVAKYLEGKNIVKDIIVPDKLINFVIK